jgi:hypothetical protein
MLPNLLSPYSTSPQAAPLPGRLIDAIIRLGQAEEHEDGAMAIRMGSDQALELFLEGFCAADVARAPRITVIWDREEEQLLDVLEWALPVQATVEAEPYAALRMKRSLPLHSDARHFPRAA